MSTTSIIQQVQWQDLKVRSEVDVVLEIAKREGWKDCGIFGHGDMITQPRESTGWKLIPADLYEAHIPPEGVRRIHRIINSGVRIQGVIIADDGRGIARPFTPARPSVALPSVKAIASFIGTALLRLVSVAAAIALFSLFAFSLIYFAPVLIVLGFLFGIGSAVVNDPKIVILVDDGQGGTVWVSLFTWYD